MKGSAPKPPDPAKTAKAQMDTNFTTGLINQSLGSTNQVTPFGSLTYDRTGTDTITGPDGQVYEVPRYTATTKLDPAQEGILRSQQVAQRGLADVAGKQVTTLGDVFSANGFEAPELTRTYNTDFSTDRQRVEEALMSRLNPSIDRDRESLRTSLANQGIREGSEAFDRAMARADEAATDARMQAVLAGGQEQSRLVGLEADRARFENDAAGQQFNMNASARTQPINEIIALLSGSPIQAPQFASTPGSQVAGVDRAGLEMDAYNGRLNAYNTRQQGLGSILGAGATLLGAPQGAVMAGLGGLFR